MVSIAKSYDISRQRIWQIIKKAGFKKDDPLLDNGSENMSSVKLYVLGKLLTLGASLEGIQIEVRHVIEPTVHMGLTYYTIYSPDLRPDTNFCIVVCGTLDSPITYVFPREIVRKRMYLPAIEANRTRRSIYREAWHLLV